MLAVCDLGAATLALRVGFGEIGAVLVHAAQRLRTTVQHTMNQDELKMRVSH